MPAPDPDLHHQGPVRLPDDPTGIAEPHDVLAAEEFPMPAPPPGSAALARAPHRSAGVWLAAVALTWLARRLLRR